jgi:hypothetical protein
MQKKDMKVGTHYAYRNGYRGVSRVVLLEPSGQSHYSRWETEFGTIEVTRPWFDKKNPVLLGVEPDGSAMTMVKRSWRDADDDVHPHVFAGLSKDILAEWDEWHNVIQPRQDAEEAARRDALVAARNAIYARDEEIRTMARRVGVEVSTDSTAWGNKVDQMRKSRSVRMAIRDFEGLVREVEAYRALNTES